MSSSPLLMSSAFSYLPPPAMPIGVRAHTCAPAHTHPSPLRHTPTTTSAAQPAGKMEGTISLHFLHFSFEVRGGSSRAGKSFHYGARRLDNNNKLDGSGADEKRNDRTNRGKKRTRAKFQHQAEDEQQPPIRMQHFKWSVVHERVDGYFALMQLVCSARTASAFIVAKTAKVRQDKKRQDKTRKLLLCI